MKTFQIKHIISITGLMMFIILAVGSFDLDSLNDLGEKAIKLQETANELERLQNKNDELSNSKSSMDSSNLKSALIKMLEEYNDIIDEYANVMKKVSAGDMSAMSKMVAYTEKLTKWMEEWNKKLVSSNDVLSPDDLADIMKEYQKLLEKYQKIASSL